MGKGRDFELHRTREFLIFIFDYVILKEAFEFEKCLFLESSRAPKLMIVGDTWEMETKELSMMHDRSVVKWIGDLLPAQVCFDLT